jgi:hypothetical protein
MFSWFKQYTQWQYVTSRDMTSHHVTWRDTTNRSPISGSVPSLQSLCRLAIRRLTGPNNLHRLLELKQPPSSGYLAHRGEKPTNTDDSIPRIKRKTSCLARRALLENENLDQETKYLSLTSKSGSCEEVVDSADLIPGPIRRYLLHVDEYEMWWEMRKKNKIFAIAAAGSSRYRWMKYLLSSP